MEVTFLAVTKSDFCLFFFTFGDCDYGSICTLKQNEFFNLLANLGFILAMAMVGWQYFFSSGRNVAFRATFQ